MAPLARSSYPLAWTGINVAEAIPTTIPTPTAMTNAAIVAPAAHAQAALRIAVAEPLEGRDRCVGEFAHGDPFTRRWT